MKDISVKALAKINLGLDVVRKREDGYHEVRMVMQTIHLFDRLEISKNTSGEITMETNLSFLPTNENNLVYKAAKLLQDEFATVRAGRANPAILDRVTVDYYGTPTPVGQVGTISSPDPRTLVIQPWDGSLLKAIEKAIQTSDLGINPQNDGRVIRLVFPQLTEERRKDLTKQVRKYAEDAKVAVRNIRRDAVDYVKKAQKKGELTEDDQKKAEKDIQDLTDKHVKKIDEMCAKKEKELMEI